MRKNKLIYFVIGLASGLVLTPRAFAEHYVVCGSPAVHLIDLSSRSCHIKKHHHKIKHKHKRKRHACYRRFCRSKSVADISVFYIWDSFPTACSCQPCQNCTPCSYCGSPSSPVYVTNQSDQVITHTYDFDFDRRTADDIGSNLNIDY